MVRLTLDEVRKRLFAINPNIEILSNSYTSLETRLHCKCGKCDCEWETSFRNLKQRKVGCPRCAKMEASKKIRLSLDEVKHRLFKVNPFIMILSDEYKNCGSKLLCKCLICANEWYASYDKLHNSQTGCPECKAMKIANAKRLTLDEVKKRLFAINPNIKILSSFYKNDHTHLELLCKICNKKWGASFKNLQNRKTGCPRCAKKESKVEIDFLNTFEGWIKDRKILGGKELDAYFAKEKLAVEINGCFWHSTYQTRIDKSYHLNKTNICESKGVKLLHFWDFEIKENFEFCKQIVLENLNEAERLKDFEIREVETLCFELYDSNGFKRSNLRLKHIQPNSYEITEFNGLNKQNLYDFFVLQYKPSKIIAKLNRRFHSIFDNYALKLGFKLVKITKPSYFRYKEAKCYDCGNLVYERGLE